MSFPAFLHRPSRLRSGSPERDHIRFRCLPGDDIDEAGIPQIEGAALLAVVHGRRDWEPSTVPPLALRRGAVRRAGAVPLFGPLA